jgi:hypothetical protein
MTQPLSAGIATRLEAEIIGRLRVADYTLAVGSEQGICLSPAVGRPAIVAKPPPILQVPPAFSRFQGRQAEVAAAIAALQANQLIILSGPPGIGKSALLRHLAHHQQVTTSRSDGILYLKHGQDLADLQQTLIARFYRTTPDAQPNEAEISQLLQNQQIILLIEDCQLAAADLIQLKALLPKSACLVVATARLGTSAAVEIELTGLAWLDAVTLIEQELGGLAPAQMPIVESLWRLLQGHPQRLRQVAVLVREDGLSWARVMQQLQPDSARSLAHLILATLPKTQRWIVALLVAMQGVGLTAEQIAVMSGPPHPQTSLHALLQRYLIQLEDDRYRLAANLVDLLQADFDAGPWMERVLAHLVPWAEQHRHLPPIIGAEQAVILHTIRWAVDRELWGDVLRLVRSLEGTLCLSKQWQVWEQVLQWGLQAAWALEDARAESWVLHQLGTRAAGLEDVTTAYDALSQALTLRRSLGDEMGSQLTQNNLELLKQFTLPPPGVRRGPDHRGRVYLTLSLIGLVVFVVSGLIGWAIANQFKSSTEPTPVESVRP